MSTLVNMGILGTDYTLRSSHVLFLLMVASSVLLGFSYLNEMYQRIQLQEKFERQTQHMVAERSIIQHRASLLQTQIENRNKEMKRLQDIHAFQAEQQNTICEKERNDLLQTISSKGDAVTEVQTQYDSLKQRFEHLRSIMEQFENNQSRLLEKFSTQSTQCMNVINMLSKLCYKGKGIMTQKTAQKPETNETSVNATAESENSDHNKSNILMTMQKLQELVSELNNTNSTKNNEDRIINLGIVRNSTEVNIFKSQTEEGENDNDDTTMDEKDHPENILIKQTTEQQPEKGEKLPALKEALESENHDQTRIEKLNDLQNPMLPKTESLQLSNKNSRKAEQGISLKEDLTDEPVESITQTEGNTKSEGKSNGTGNILEIKKMSQTEPEEEKTPDEEIYKAESEYEDSIKERNMFKAQPEEVRNDDDDEKTLDENDLPKNILIKQTTEQQKLPALNEAALESEKRDPTGIEKVNNLQNLMLPKTESLRPSNKNSRTADRGFSSKEDLTDEPIESVTLAEDNTGSEGKSHGTGSILEFKKMSQTEPEKVKTPDEEVYKAESEYENNIDDEELNDQEIKDKL